MTATVVSPASAQPLPSFAQAPECIATQPDYQRSHTELRLEPAPSREFADSLERAEALYVAKNYAAALPLFRAAAEAGQARALVRLGMLYANGDGVAQDEEASLGLYRQAADLGDAVALRNIAALYVVGDGLPKRYDIAQQWAARAASANVPSAMFILGSIFQDGGHGLSPDLGAAMTWFHKGAALDDPDSMNSVGTPATPTRCPSRLRREPCCPDEISRLPSGSP